MSRTLIRNILLLTALLAIAGRALLADRAPSKSAPGATISDLRAADTPLRAVARPGSRAQPSLSSLPAQYQSCTTLVYQEWEDDNWELHIAAGDGSSDTRLTDNTSDDEAPAMASGCGQIIFSADRDDNQDIYAMEPDGSGTIRLTSQPARDVLPAVSLDGTMVAFQTYRHGDEPEIYLFDLATHMETRLTDDQTYDGQPDWAPDGQRIAFISDRSGNRNIWVMDGDGSQLEQITDLTHAAAPKWSPDGQRIAFASDDLDTGFTSLWVVNADGSDPRVVLRADGDQSDAWPDDWSYDSRYILFEEADWEYDNGWYITGASLDIVDPDQIDDRQRLVTGGVSMAAAWALCDLAAPTVTMPALAPVSQSPIQVAWHGEDDYSDTITYQIQYRPGGDISWTTWQVSPGQDWTTLTSGEFAWEALGGTISFRVRGADLMGHVSGWAPSTDGWITTLPAQIGGTVHDARGNPLPGAVVSCPDSPLSDAVTDSAGAFQLMLAGAWAPNLVAEMATLEGQSLSLPAFANTQGLTFWLAESDGTLKNGDFEQGLVGWYTEGDVAIVQQELGYGEKSVLLAKRTLCAEPEALARTVIEQEATVPADASHPTLSLAYALGDWTDAPVGTMTLSVTSGGSEVEVYRATLPAVWNFTPSGERFPMWQHAYVDLAPWRGKTVTVSIAHDKELGYGMLLVDQASITDWRTPYATSLDPAAVPVGEQGEVRIGGHNLSAETVVRIGDRNLSSQWAADHLLVDVPADMAQGRHDVWVTNPNGLASVRHNYFTVGGFAALPVILLP